MSNPNSSGSKSTGEEVPLRIQRRRMITKTKITTASEEDLALKQQLELQAERVQDADTGPQKNLELRIDSSAATSQQILDGFAWILPSLKTLYLTLGSTKFIENFFLMHISNFLMLARGFIVTNMKNASPAS